MNDKFKVNVTDESIYIVDVETGRMLNMHDKYEVKQLVTLLNDMYKVIKTEWGYKK